MNPSRPTRWWRAIAVATISGLSLAACGSSDDRVASPATLKDTTSPTTAPTVVPIVGVYDSVAAYPACGNEPFTHDGVTWYPIGSDLYEPFDEDMQQRLHDLRAVDRETSPVSVRHGFKRVVAPGPGDDVGTLVVWADGVARWVSDSRDLDVWLIDEPVTYNWVC